MLTDHLSIYRSSKHLELIGYIRSGGSWSAVLARQAHARIERPCPVKVVEDILDPD